MPRYIPGACLLVADRPQTPVKPGASAPGFFKPPSASAVTRNEVEFLSPRRVEESPETQTATQRSGCGLERRSSGMSELSAAAGSEGYGACSDEAA